MVTEDCPDTPEELECRAEALEKREAALEEREAEVRRREWLAEIGSLTSGIESRMIASD